MAEPGFINKATVSSLLTSLANQVSEAGSKLAASKARGDRITLEGIARSTVGNVLGGFQSLSRVAREVTHQDSPVIGQMTSSVGGLDLTRNSAALASLEAITGSTESTGDTLTNGFLEDTVGNISAEGISRSLPSSASLSNITSALGEAAASANISNILSSTGSLPNVTSQAMKGLSDVAKAKQAVLDFPMQNLASGDLGPIGLSFGNIFGNLVTKALSGSVAKAVGDQLSNLTEQQKLQGYIENFIIDKDGSTATSEVMGKASDIVTDNIFPTVPGHVVGKTDPEFKGYDAFDPNLDAYTFGYVDTAEELEAEFKSISREVTTLVVGWTGYSGPPEKVNARVIHQKITEWTKKNIALSVVESNPTEFGIQSHLIILKDGGLQRGRPMNSNAGLSISKFPKKGVNVTIVADKKSPPNRTQMDTVEMITKAWYKAYPGGQIISANEIDENLKGPGFSMRDYLSGLYTKLSVYKSPDTLSDAYDIKTLNSVKPDNPASPMSAGETPLSASDAIAEVDTFASLNEATGEVKELTKSEIDTNIAKFKKLNSNIDLLSKDIISDSKTMKITEFASDARKKIEDRLDLNNSTMATFNKDHQKIKQDLMNAGYIWDGETWSKPSEGDIETENWT